MTLPVSFKKIQWFTKSLSNSPKFISWIKIPSLLRYIKSLKYIRQILYFLVIWNRSLINSLLFFFLGLEKKWVRLSMTTILISLISVKMFDNSFSMKSSMSLSRLSLYIMNELSNCSWYFFSSFGHCFSIEYFKKEDGKNSSVSRYITFIFSVNIFFWRINVSNLCLFVEFAPTILLYF